MSFPPAEASSASAPGLAHGWTQGPAQGDAQVLERTDVRSGGHRVGYHIHVLVVGDNSRQIAAPLTRDLTQSFPNLCFDRIQDLNDLGVFLEDLGDDDHVVLGVATSEVPNVDALIESARASSLMASTQWMLVSDQEIHTDLAVCTESGHLASVVRSPWTVPLLSGQAYSTMRRYLEECGYCGGEILALIQGAPSFAVQGPILEGLDLNEAQVVHELLEGVERVLGPRPRIILPRGTHLLTQGHRVEAVHLVLEGTVSLHRDSRHGEVLAHLATSGPLIGLISLARGESAFFTALTTSEATVVRLTTEQLQIALTEDPSISTVLTALAIRSLTRRLMRAEDLHVENALLAEDLERQKEELAATLEDLRATRAKLVEGARFAMLGELSAGIAHELNNPVTALLRAAGHLREDTEDVVSSPEPEACLKALNSAMDLPPLSTARERELQKEFLPILHDRSVIRQLIRAGLSDREQAQKLADDPKQLLAFQAGARLGSSLRSVLASGERIIALTQSLKGYARPDADERKEVDVRRGIDDVLRLTSHRVHGIEVVCEYEDVEPVLAHPSKLQQVWTNLIVNAAEAIEDEAADLKACAEASPASGIYLPARGHDEARITIRVAMDGDQVEVQICDNGPGIAPEVLDRIMEPHFTTKAGRVRFGLGMGMSIVHSIIADLDGRLLIDSHPGSTTMRILIPAHHVHEEES